MAIKLRNPNGNVSLTTPVIKEGTADLTNYYTKNETDTLIDSAIQNIDLSDYATKTELEQYDKSHEVDAKIAAIEIPEVDLEPYALKSEIPDVSNFATKDEIPSIEGLASESYVDEKLADVEVPVATLDSLGVVRPDGVTIVIKDGVLTVVGGGGGGVFETPTQFKNDLRLFQCLTVLQNKNSLEVY